MPTLLSKDGQTKELYTLVPDLVYCFAEEAEHFDPDFNWLKDRIEYYNTNPETGKVKKKRRTREQINNEALRKRKDGKKQHDNSPDVGEHPRRSDKPGRVQKARTGTPKTTGTGKKVKKKGKGAK
jgi:hypothetical protein